MSITFACESCGKSFTLDDKFAGKKGKCKQCGAMMAIPQAIPTVPLASSRPVARETAPPRRPAAPAGPPVDDVYGFDDVPKSPAQELPDGIDEVEGAVAPGRFKPRAAGAFDPPKPRKKKGSGGVGVGTIVKIAVGIVFGLAAIGVAGSLLMGLAGLSSKGELESILQERVRLNQELAGVLAKVTDVDTASQASPMANQKFRAIAANLRKLKATKGLQVHIDALKQQYAAAQLQATQQVINEINRIGQIPGAGDALAVSDAVDELGREEAGIPGNVQAPPPPRAPFIPPPGMPNAPPGMNPGQNPGQNPGANRPNNNRNRPNRKGANRPNAGGPG